ncbi:MAG: peptide-methionine (S)-S-oxide reductase MsrA [Verrucomicrobiae bacterium]|nr:peptide-methionine (S)-S-oxide reductase MsrA [Verrucomicrobiae bacterium]
MAQSDSLSPLRPLSFLTFFAFCASAALALSACQKEENSLETAPAENPPKTAEPSAPAQPVKEEADSSSSAETKKASNDDDAKKSGTEVATFGGGCFWCMEAVMERLEGVTDVKSGYMGGHVDNPTYEQVCQKNTGHIEIIQVEFDPSKIDFNDLLDVFWQAHDPTTLDQQGADHGPQYRSVIFTHSPEQKAKAEKSKKALDESGKYGKPAVTEIRDAKTFWEAEGYHQDFYQNNKNYPYCRVVISPKLKKLDLE